MTRIQLQPLERQVVVLVGATSGIGRETARRLAARGATLAISARDATDVATIERELMEAGAADVLSTATDVADPAAVARLADETVTRFGRIDSWVHVAGVDLFAPFEETRPDEFRRVIEINLLGVAYGLMAAVPAIRATGAGAVIVVSSLEASVPSPDQTAYAASKHGVDGLLRSLRMELESEGVPIAVTQVQPASIDTPLFRVARTRLGVEPRPLGPVYDPVVVADLIVHATEHPSRELFAGGAGWAMDMAQRLTPRLNEAVMSRMNRWMLRSDEPKSAAAANNLDSPVDGVTAIRGGYGGRRFSVLNPLQTLPTAARLGIVVALGGLMLAARRRR